jgi:hypothetical protein
MKRFFLVILLLLLINISTLFSKDIIEKFIIDSTSIMLIQQAESDSLITLIPKGSLTYKNGKLSSGKIKIFFQSDSTNLFQTLEAETYAPSGNCFEDDTLRISFERTFHNSRAANDEPNYTAMAKICFKGFDYTLAFPVKMEVMETFVVFRSNFLIDLKKIYSKLGYNDIELDEFKTTLEIKAIDKNLLLQE